MSNTMQTNISRQSVVSALSQALDLAEHRYVLHGQRVAYIATTMAERLDLPPKDIVAVYYGALLHDIGITGLGGVRSLADDEFIYRHGYLGSMLVADLPIAGTEMLVRYHHENFDGSGPNRMEGENIPLGARLVRLADAVDEFIAGNTLNIGVKQAIKEAITQGKGSLFDPHLSDVFLEVSRPDRFWFDLSTGGRPGALKVIETFDTLSLAVEDLEGIARVFARIIDSKSSFTHNHSLGLAETLKKVAQKEGFSPITSRTLYCTGLLHDLGKLAVPNSMLEKPAALSPEEYYVMKSHVYYTKKILSGVKGMEQVANWSGNHHERLNGTGYADALGAASLGFEDRLVAVCDVYQALREERPYREGVSEGQALEIIDTMVRSGGLCKEAAKMVSLAIT